MCLRLGFQCPDPQCGHVDTSTDFDEIMGPCENEEIADHTITWQYLTLIGECPRCHQDYNRDAVWEHADRPQTESLEPISTNHAVTEQEALENVYSEFLSLSTFEMNDEPFLALPPPPTPPPPSPGHGQRTPRGLSFAENLPLYTDPFLPTHRAANVLSCPIMRMQVFSKGFEDWLIANPDLKCNCIDTDAVSHFLIDGQDQIICLAGMVFDENVDFMAAIKEQMLAQQETGYVDGVWIRTTGEQDHQPNVTLADDMWSTLMDVQHDEEGTPPPAWKLPEQGLSQVGLNLLNGLQESSIAPDPSGHMQLDDMAPWSPPPAWSEADSTLLEISPNSRRQQESSYNEDEVETSDEDMSDDRDEEMSSDSELSAECPYEHHFAGRRYGQGQAYVCACHLGIEEHTLMFGSWEDGRFVL